MDPATVSPYATLQYMRNPEGITDLARVPLAPIFHHAGAADNLEVGNLRQLGQNVVLDTIGKRRVLFVFAQVFKWKHGDSCCYWTAD